MTSQCYQDVNEHSFKSYQYIHLMFKLLFVTFLVLSVYGESTDYSNTNQALLAGYTFTSFAISQYNNEMWLAQIGIGSPQQLFTVQVDTGSNILWVPYHQCKFCDIKTRYTPGTDYAPTGGTYYQAYGSGECSGLIAFDQVALINTPISQNFEMMFATYENGFAEFPGFDGIMGLSNNQTFTNLFQAAYAAGQIASPYYALALNPYPLDSYLIYDEIDEAMAAAIQWVTPSNLYRWELAINTFSINGVDYTDELTIPNALLDSGTSCLVLSEQLFLILYETYMEPMGCFFNGAVYCPCSPTNLDTAPIITVAFNTVTVEIPWYNLIIGYYNAPAGDTCQACLSYIGDNPFMIFGDPALMSFVPVFDKTNNMIGIIGGQPNDFPNAPQPGPDPDEGILPPQ